MTYNFTTTTVEREIRHFHLFAGVGGGAKGFNQGTARVGNMIAKFRCIGGIDIDPGALKDFKKLVGIEGTVLDLFSTEQYIDFHGHLPPASWRETTIADIHRASGFETPNIIFISAPCKGFSSLLSKGKSQTKRYSALNQLTLRGLYLSLEAYRDDPPELILFENVPLIASRGRILLDKIIGLLRSFNYEVAETNHDCGELGGLAESRKRFLLVARHREKVPPFLYEPTKQRLRAIGEVLSRMPLPGAPEAGPLHRVPSLQWKTWLRLAFVEAGSDWRSLSNLRIQDGTLQDYALAPDTKWHKGILGVRKWSDTSGVVAGRSLPGNGAFSVADPRVNSGPEQHCYKIVPRIDGTNEAVPLGDLRRGTTYEGGGKYRVSEWGKPTGTVIAASTTGNGAFALADPRIAESIKPEIPQTLEALNIPRSQQNVVAMIRSLDGTWHRPFTTLELAALQSLMDPEEYLELEGLSDSAWRERIGNAVPPAAAKAIADTMGTTLLLAWSGEKFALSNVPIWVRSLAIALSVSHPQYLN